MSNGTEITEPEHTLSCVRKASTFLEKSLIDSSISLDELLSLSKSLSTYCNGYNNRLYMNRGVDEINVR